MSLRLWGGPGLIREKEAWIEGVGLVYSRWHLLIPSALSSAPQLASPPLPIPSGVGLTESPQL